jgi:hypothetical protein
MSDVLNLNKYQNDINLALDGSIKPTVLTQDDSSQPSTENLIWGSVVTTH